MEIKKSEIGIKATPVTPLATVENAASFPANCNPFNHDSMSMGAELPDQINGQTVYAMQYMDGVYLVNAHTGKRFKLKLDPSFFEEATDSIGHLSQEYSYS